MTLFNLNIGLCYYYYHYIYIYMEIMDHISKSWNNLCLNKLLFTKIYIKNFKKILKKHLLSKYENQLNN